MLELLLSNVYFILIPLAIVEGPLLAVVCGVGVAFGVLNPWLVWGVLVFGDFAPDVVYYWVGRLGARIAWVRRIATRTRLIRDNFLAIEQLWHTNTFVTLLRAKLSWAIAGALIVSAGLAAVSWWRFAILSLAISIPYLGALEVLGYALGQLYGSLGEARQNGLAIISVIALLCFATLLVTFWLNYKSFDPKIARNSNLIKDTEI